MNNDVLEEAFGLLKAHSLERGEHQFELEEKLMAVQCTSTPRTLSTLARVAAVVVALCLVVGIAEATTGVLRKVVSVFIDSGNGPEKVGDFDVNERGGLTVGVGVGLSGPDGSEFTEPGVATFEIDSSELDDGKVTLGFEVEPVNVDGKAE